MSDHFLVIFSESFPDDLLAGDVIMFPLIPSSIKRPSIRCKSVSEALSGMLELVPVSENQLQVRNGSLWVHSHHVLAVC